jgi:hypothetical protein
LLPGTDSRKCVYKVIASYTIEQNKFCINQSLRLINVNIDIKHFIDNCNIIKHDYIQSVASSSIGILIYSVIGMLTPESFSRKSALSSNVITEI